MKYLSSARSRWVNSLLILLPVLVALACNFPPGNSAAVTPTPVKVSATADVTPTSATVRIPADVTFGPGPFNLTDMTTGLADLASYKATLTYSFDGTRDGNAEQWSKTYVMSTTREPAARQLSIETTGNSPALEAVFMAEVNGVAYERLPGRTCTAHVIEQQNSFADWLEPAGILTSVIGAEAAGGETVNAVAAEHYTFDERALGGADLIKSTGELWVATEGGYLVKYLLTTQAAEDYFGEGIEGTLTLDYELTDPNQPVTLEIHKDCPPGMVDAPRLPDASAITETPGVLIYQTATGLKEAAAFYQKEIPELGWEVVSKASILDTTAMLGFTREAQTLTVILTAKDNVTTVHVVLSRSQE